MERDILLQATAKAVNVMKMVNAADAVQYQRRSVSHQLETVQYRRQPPRSKNSVALKQCQRAGLILRRGWTTE